LRWIAVKSSFIKNIPMAKNKKNEA